MGVRQPSRAFVGFFFFRFSSLLACAAPRWSESISRCFRRLELLLHKATTLRAAIRCMLSLHQAAVKLHDATTQIHYNSLVHNFTTTVSSILHYAEHWPAPALKSFLAFTAFAQPQALAHSGIRFLFLFLFSFYFLRHCLKNSRDGFLPTSFYWCELLSCFFFFFSLFCTRSYPLHRMPCC